MNLDLILKTIDLIESEIQYIPLTNGIDLLSSHKKYYLSRVSSSLIPSAFSYLKLAFSRNISFKQIKERQEKSHFFSSTVKESEYIQILVLLRISMELYSELALIENSSDFETACKNKIWFEFIKERNNIRKNIHSYYEFQSPSFEKYYNDGKTKYDKLAQYSYNKSTAGRFKDLFNDSNLITRRLLGLDYYNLYSFLSKKIHFDQRNSLEVSAPPELYFSWYYNFFVRSSKIILSINSTETEKFDFLEQEINKLNLDLIDGNIAIIIGSAVKTEFGLGHVTEIEESKPGLYRIKLAYDYSRFVDPGYIDIIPAPIVSLFTQESLDSIQSKYTESRQFLNFNKLFLAVPKSSFESLIEELLYLPTKNCFGK
ncbi:hypothetical protein [Leptospira ilyithenensis]|uniref:Uncharacterized protein n=1 Tax=Leptospira ilyithenensis TaxID=2484901 RepID=A0A4R9LR67_9LEPT|nr:hypothetical protein [Leptospira ilyithenensis]TGN13108.1 hypothetical protein EHS11_04810 [Leptospira ilyithenensis]